MRTAPTTPGMNPAMNPVMNQVPRPASHAAGTATLTAPAEESPVTTGSGIPELRFVRPLPGFAELTRYALVRVGASPEPDGVADIGSSDDVEDRSGVPAAGSEEIPVVFELRSLEAPDVRFLVAHPGAFFPEYGFELDSDAAEDLGLSDAGDAMTLVVLTMGDDSVSTTANLLAPVVVNARNRSAAQIILSGSDWPVRANVA